jgi:hypothetical protein
VADGGEIWVVFADQVERLPDRPSALHGLDDLSGQLRQLVKDPAPTGSLLVRPLLSGGRVVLGLAAVAFELSADGSRTEAELQGNLGWLVAVFRRKDSKMRS